MDNIKLDQLVRENGIGSIEAEKVRNTVAGMVLTRNALTNLTDNGGLLTAEANNYCFQAEVLLGQNDDPRVAGKM